MAKSLGILSLALLLGLGTGAFGFEKETPAMKALKDFTTCLEAGQDLEALGNCTKPFLEQSLSQQQRKRILSWFLSHQPLRYLPCDEQALKKGQRKFPEAGILFVCAVEEAALPQNPMTLLVLKQVDGKPKLLNIAF